MSDRSRAPAGSPLATSSRMEGLVLAAREAQPTWGGRKLRRVLLNEGLDPPSASTITQILKRHGRLTGPGSGAPGAWMRFEREQPNELWQMDFKGHFQMLSGRCHPLDVLDDHSRYCLCLQACRDEQGSTVKERLDELFRLYGLPVSLLCDNGGPWGGHGIYPALAVYLMRLGIRLLHGRPSHPQTQGKLERFHRTLDLDVIQGRNWSHLDECQNAFNGFRRVYNFQRPHDSLGLAAPASRYKPSPFELPEHLPPVEYSDSQRVRRVQAGGLIHLDGIVHRVGKGLRGQLVAVSTTEDDGVLHVRFVNTIVKTLNLRHNPSTNGDVV